MTHRVICIGGMLIDELFYCHQTVVPGTSNPASVKKAAGGVMRNIVHHLTLLDVPVQFITVVGDDADGEWLKNNCRQAGIDMSNTATVKGNTGKYSAILNPDGSLYTAACVNECEPFLTIQLLQDQQSVLSAATVIVADTNLNTTVLEWLITFCKEKSIKLFIDPVSVEKAKKLSRISLDGLYMVTPNEDELPSLIDEDLSATATVQKLISRGVKNIWLRKGAEGSSMYATSGSYSLPSPVVSVTDITGAGDSALAAWIAAFSLGKSEKECLLAAHSMAAAILQVEGAIDHNINQQTLFNSIKDYYPNEQ